ncbi:HAMP domain-containing histidine kinase [Altererythrobacter sp. CC-YST694]|uniref:sensor histidine kinase n=1 Tax=Altererythrobacter sp. CC-YST694 TaxID=2755038 RepID=UPI001D032121|nr:HAMP domain-containing sensor histidine kinase [Altererythrobacter sp. CC-YST694]MCB5424571.1 HAMP domain-containing histidine kinase [Altererythrobacter sp. CC-YST694]
MALATKYIAQARSDADDRLVEADELLAVMQLRSGGELPGVIATPALLELVRKARRYGLKLAQPIQAQFGQEAVTAWVEVLPDDAGCIIGLANWQSAQIPSEDPGIAESRRAEIDRDLAELIARLDPQQAILSADTASRELRVLAAAMRKGIGRPWTDFIEVEGSQHHQPLHWRLLDGAAVRLPGSNRHWRASLVPLGGAEPGSNGFELYLSADQPPTQMPLAYTAEAPRAVPGAAIGRDVAPVLRQPIARIIANAETIRTRLAGPLAEEYSNYAADIAAAGQHLLALIDDLSDLEVVEAEEFTTAPDRIDLADVTRRAVGILAVRAQEQGIAIDPPALAERLPAVGEFRRVLQVLLNLIGNAIRYAPEGSRVHVELGSGAGEASVTIADEGQGLSQEQQAKVFDKFERLGRSGDGGSGLGLYISRKLARAMGGELSVSSMPGKGARFTLTLPREDR